MSTQFTNRQWRLPNNENKDKQSNYSMDFDGSQYIDAGTGLGDSLGGSYSGDLTVSMWLKFNSISTQNGLFYIGDLAGGGGSFWINTSLSKIWLQANNGSAGYINCSISSLNTTDWYNLTFVYKGYDIANSKIYINNVSQTLTTSGNFNYTYDFTSKKTAIGDYYTTPPFRGFDGKIDAVSIFNYALTDGTGGTVNQIATLYGSSSTGIGNPMSLSPAPVAYYPLGDQDAFNGADYLVPNSSLKDYVFDFDGSNDYIDCGNDSSLNISGDLTISAWVKINNYDSYNAVISKIDSSTRNYEILIRPSIPTGGISFYVANSSFITSTGTIPLNTWTHIIVTVESGVTNGAKIYINGSQDATTGTLTINSNTANLNIGRRTTGSFYIDGKISNTQIFNTALPATGSNSVETLYNNGSPLTSMSGFTSLQGWWKLDASATYDSSTTTWTIPDDSSNSNDGTSSGMTQSALQQSDLSFKTSYSPYALLLDGTDDYIEIPSTTDFAFSTGGFTISLWVNFNSLTSGGYNILDFRTSGSGTTVGSLWINSTNGLRWYVNGGYLSANIPAASFLNNTWYNVIILNNGSTTSFYLDGASIDSASDSTSYTAAPLTIGDYSGGGYVVNGSISNVSIWNATLTSSQVTEIYNEGVPSNLNNHSAYSNLVSWWQLGSNTSWVDPYWIALDEKGTNNGESQNVAAPNNMGENAIVDGVGSYANGLSSGMGGDEVIGDAPYSSSNSLSVNMDVEDRTTDTPS